MITFGTENENCKYFTVIVEKTIKKGGIPFLETIFRILILLIKKIKPGSYPIFLKLQICLSPLGVPLISGIAHCAYLSR